MYRGGRVSLTVLRRSCVLHHNFSAGFCRYVPPLQDEAADDLSAMRPLQPRYDRRHNLAPPIHVEEEHFTNPRSITAAGDEHPDFAALFLAEVLPVIPRAFSVPLSCLGSYLDAVLTGKRGNMSAILCGGASKHISVTNSNAAQCCGAFKSTFGSLLSYLRCFDNVLLEERDDAQWFVRRANGTVDEVAFALPAGAFEECIAPLFAAPRQCSSRPLQLEWRTLCSRIVAGELEWPPKALAEVQRRVLPPAAPPAWLFFAVADALEQKGLVAVQFSAKAVISLQLRELAPVSLPQGGEASKASRFTRRSASTRVEPVGTSSADGLATVAEETRLSQENALLRKALADLRARHLAFVRQWLQREHLPEIRRRR